MKTYFCYFDHFAITRLHFYHEDHYSWSLDLSYIDKFNTRKINLASPLLRFFLLLIFESIRSSSRFSFSSPVRTSLCRGSMFAIRDRAAATRIMTLVTRKSSWPKRSAELVPARSSASFTYSASFFSSFDPLTILSQLFFLLFSSISYQKSSELNACNRLIH